MLAKHRLTISMACAVVALAGGILLFSGGTAASYQQAAAAKWEYKTNSVDAVNLQLELNDLGEHGWEVFSVTRAELSLDQNAGQTRLISDKYQVTAKRRTQ